MTLPLQPFANVGLNADLLHVLLDEHGRVALPRLERLWRYYRNHLSEPTVEGGSTAPPAQRVGLPPRLRNEIAGDQTGVLVRDDRSRREIVIENDIAWRIHTLVDFMFPSAPKLISTASDPVKRAAIEAALQAVMGDLELWQNAALLGSVYGHVDFLVDATNAQIAIHTIEAPRIIGVLNPRDYRLLDAVILHWTQPTNRIKGGRSRSRAGAARSTVFERLKSMLRSTPMDCNPWASGGGASLNGGAERESLTITEIHSAARMQRYEDDRLVEERVNALGVLPVVHVQNLAMPLQFAGLSDVEPLIPLQDELNTRLSDRANRVTMQSFRMWLGKGIDTFFERPVGPGQMWTTDNENASIEAFGGDADSPSERQHLEDLREAMDKASGVTPAAAGHIKARVGNLTSENALRISLMGTLAKINRKRVTYGQGIQKLAALVLHALDVTGALRSSPSERGIEIAWPDALPDDQSRKLADALQKARLGIPLHVIRAELGYGDEGEAPAHRSMSTSSIAVN